MGNAQKELMNSEGIRLSKLDLVSILDREFEVLEKSINLKIYLIVF